MGEELAEHERVIRLRMVFWDTNVFIHVESDHILESKPYFSVSISTKRNSSKTHESFPSLTNFTKALYVGIGEEPVGNPNTNGFSGVGAKSLILWK